MAELLPVPSSSLEFTPNLALLPLPYEIADTFLAVCKIFTKSCSVNRIPPTKNSSNLTMASKISSALPAHLKPSAMNGNGDSDSAAFARKHHGKTQSHVVSTVTLSLFYRKIHDQTRKSLCRMHNKIGSKQAAQLLDSPFSNSPRWHGLVTQDVPA